MSIDGPGILESDLGHDVYNNILDLYDSGAELAEIRKRLASACQSNVNDDVDKEIFLAASAKAFWEIGHLESELRDDLANLVHSGTSLALWKELADTALSKRRKAILNRLLRQIAVPKKTPRPRKKYAKVSAKLFSIGDCLSIEADGQVHRAVVCKIIEYRGQCEYAILMMEGKTESTAESFIRSRYYGRRIPDYGHGLIPGPHVVRCEHRMLKRSGEPFRFIGNIPLNPERLILGSYGGVLEMAHVVEDFVRTKERPDIFGLELLPLRELLDP